VNYPELETWPAVRARIRERVALLHAPETHDAAHQANWEDLNSIFCRPMAMGLCYMPRLYSLWPAYWMDWMLRQYLLGLNCGIAGPRRRGKTATAQLYQSFKMLTLEWTYSLHINLSPELVMQNSQRIIQELETNQRLQEDFNIHHGPGLIQQQEHYEIFVGKRHRTKLAWEWMTRDGKPRGVGPHGILVDDIDDPDDTPYVMEKYYNKVHGSIMGALEGFEDSNAQIIVCGNYTGRNCAMRKFQEIDAAMFPDRWIVAAIPAIEEGKTQDITKTEVGESVWPEKFSTGETKQKIAEMNVTRLKSGDMELQNRFADAGDLIWLPEMLERTWTELPPKHQAVYRVYIDSSQKVKEAGDEWGIGTLGKVIDGPRKGEIMFLPCAIRPFQPDDAAEEVITQFIGNGTSDCPQCECVKMESKTDKGVDPFLELVKQKARARNVYIPTFELVPGGRDKRTRSQAAAPAGRSGAITVSANPGPDDRRCVQQMLNYTGKNDPNLKAVDDGHDMRVWGIIDLMPVESAQSFKPTKIKVRGKVRAVA
jgi:hypothetical protein